MHDKQPYYGWLALGCQRTFAMRGVQKGAFWLAGLRLTFPERLATRLVSRQITLATWPGFNFATRLVYFLAA